MRKYLDRSLVRFLLLPGTDIFTRRRTRLERNWKRGRRKVLDAGFGNGWFSYRAYKSGATVIAVANQPELITKAHALYNDFLGIPQMRMRFQQINLYEIASSQDHFDEIICYETLEHIRDDATVSAAFYSLLKPGGILHLCCPNAEHPRWRAEELDKNEAGGHVRYGYTEQSYRDLLEPIGFRLEKLEGVGGSALVFLQEKVQMRFRSWFGEPGAYLISVLSTPLVAFDSGRPRVPFSLYVRAVKPAS